MALTPEEIAASEDLERRLKQEAAQRAEAQRRLRQPSPTAKTAVTPKQQQQNNRSAQINRAAQTAKPQSRPEGLITQVGQWLQEKLDPIDNIDNFVEDAAGLVNRLPDNGFTAPIKGVANLADKIVPSSQDVDAFINRGAENLQQSSNPVVRTAGEHIEGYQAIDAGVKAGLNIPATVAARITNQAAPWSDPPAIIKDSPVGETLFEVAQILTPTLIGGGVAAGLGRAGISASIGGLTAESALETSTQDSFNDLIAGRTLAGKFGELAEHLGYDGEQFARELVEGKTINSQVLTAVVGLAQNFGINFGADRLVRYFGKGVSKSLSRSNDAPERVLGKSADDVEKSINTINEPAYSPVAEPHEVVDLDSAVPVSKPSIGKTSINDDALIRQATSGIAEDSSTSAGRAYFTSWSAVTDDNSLQRVMQEATSTLKRLKPFPDDMKTVMVRAADWWDTNKALLDQNFDSVVLDFKGLTKTLESKEGLEAILKPDVDTYLKEYAVTSEEGFLAASLVGEELGTRIQHIAAQAVKLEDNSIDFSDAIENILNLHDKLNLFLVPLRRGKRKWAVEGALQQKQQIKRLKDADIQGAIRKADPLSSDASPRSFELIKNNEADPGSTLRELWQAFQDGDDAAGATLKRYLNLIAYTDPSKVLSEATGLNQILKDGLKKGNREAGANLMYFSMLSRAATQTASTASNFARLVAEPLGAIISGERAYGFGQLVGGLQGLGDGWKVLRKAIVEGKATNSGSKIDEIVGDLAKQQVELDRLFDAHVKALREGGASNMEVLGAHMTHWMRTAANSPIVHAPGRLLMASDEWTKTIAANQVAVGRAYKEIADLGITDKKQVSRIVQQHISNVFRDSIKSGKIVDADVLSLAKNLTFQSDIPQNGNFVDNAFLSIKIAADNSGFWKFVSPFTRVSYNILETSARYEPTGIFRALVPKYKQILAGELGETAALQLKSQIAMGRAWSLMAAVGAGCGFITGVNSGNKPKQSFLIPANNAEGYIAIPYGKLEPFATLTSVIADVVNGVRDDIISEGQYERFIANVVFSLGMASFDKTFMSGMADFGAMFDAKNLSGGSLTGAANTAAILSPGIARMVASWAYPYKTINGMENNAWETFASAWRVRAIGGIGNPIRYDELTGKPIPTVATATKDDNYFGLVIGSALNEFIYPGKITNAAKNDPVKKELDTVGFKHDTYSSLRTYGGIALNPEQQSVLSKDLHDYGDLRGKLITYFDSDVYKKLRQQFHAMRKSDSAIGSSVEGTRANAVRDMIHSDIRTIYRAAKEEAVSKGRLSNNAAFQGKRYKVEGLLQLQDPQVQGILGIYR